MIVQDVTPLPTFNPHGGPITHSSTGSKPDCPVHPLFPKLFLAHGLVCNPRATVLVVYSGIRRNTYSRCSEPPFSLWFRLRATIYPLGTSYCTFVPYSRCILYVQLERYSYAHSWVNPRLFPHKHFCRRRATLIDSLVHWRSWRKDDGSIMMTWSREMKTST